MNCIVQAGAKSWTRLSDFHFLGFLGSSAGKESACNVGDLGLIQGMATHSNILAWRIPWTIVHGVAKSWTQLSDFHFTR